MTTSFSHRIPFKDRPAAETSLQRMMPVFESLRLSGAITQILGAALKDAANPDRAIINFERFLDSFPDQPRLLRKISRYPRQLEILIKLFACSQFFSDILIRHPAYLADLNDRKLLSSEKSRVQFKLEAARATADCATIESVMKALRRFQQSTLLRICAADLFGLLDIRTLTRQLSYLANALISESLQCAARITGIPADNFAVIAMGKLGGRELNYSSDIDLVFLAETPNEDAQKLGQRLIEILDKNIAGGFLYRVDMRLRPWGKTGLLVPSLEEYLQYFQSHALPWEKQALIKARYVAGNEALAQAFLHQSRPDIFNLSVDEIRAELQTMKGRIEQRLKMSGKQWGEIKSGEGSIRDIEFVTQFLQLVHGRRYPEIRSRNTLNALARLAACQILTPVDFRVLSEGYTFLRSVEHYLQIMDYRQTHRLPRQQSEMDFLARRMGFDEPNAGKQLKARYQEHSRVIRSVYRHHINREEKTSKLLPGADSAIDFQGINDTHLGRMAPAYSDTFSRETLQQHSEMANRLSKENLVEISTAPLTDNQWEVTIVGYDYPGELSLISGMLFIYGMDIIRGHIFTYEPLAAAPPSKPRFSGQRRSRFRKPFSGKNESKRKIVDVFIVVPQNGTPDHKTWFRFRDELTQFITLLKDKKQPYVIGELAKRFAAALPAISSKSTRLLPVEIEIDNTVSDNYTVLRIDTPDTIGFLYEFTNALALHNIHISRVSIQSYAERVHDTLYVTNLSGKKVTSAHGRRMLRMAILLVKQFTHLLPHSPNPVSAIKHFRDFVSQVFTQPDWPTALVALEQPEVLDALARLLGISDFLWNDFLRMQHNNLFPVLQNIEALALPKSRKNLEEALQSSTAEISDKAIFKKALNAFKDREMFRIDMRYILGNIPEFQQFSTELTDLAETVVKHSLHFACHHLVSEYGEPRSTNNEASQCSVCALGKLGGREIGFGSDIELMFIYQHDGKTDGQKTITNAEFYTKLVYAIKDIIKVKKEGIFEIDLRLRPYGDGGPLAVSFVAFQEYFHPDGPAWQYERQALIRLRPIAGDIALGETIQLARSEFLYQPRSFDIPALRAMREKQQRQLVSGGMLNAKYSPGAMVDLEYLIQALQIIHGADNPLLQTTNTSEAMKALFRAGILTPDDFQHLQAAYHFIHKLVEALRIVRGHARDLNVPAPDSDEYVYLCKRLGYNREVEKLQTDILFHKNLILQIVERIFAEM